MISSVPITVAGNLQSAFDKVVAFVATAKSAAADGITVAEFGELTVALLKTVMAALDSLPEGGAAKKQWTLDAVGLLFDAVADKAVPTLAWPVWLIVRPTVRQLVLLATSGAIESLLPLVRKAAI
jgi:hypothetical protein